MYEGGGREPKVKPFFMNLCAKIGRKITQEEVTGKGFGRGKRHGRKVYNTL